MVKTFHIPWPSPQEQEWLYARAREITEAVEEANFVHIGVEKGTSIWMNHLALEGRTYGRLVGVDLEMPVKALPDTADFIRGDSALVGQVWDVGPVDLLFVDGDHTTAGVAADIAAWLRHIITGGVVAFHDYHNGREYPHTRGVKEAVDAHDWAGWDEVPAVGSIKAFKRGRGGL